MAILPPCAVTKPSTFGDCIGPTGDPQTAFDVSEQIACPQRSAYVGAHFLSSISSPMMARSLLVAALLGFLLAAQGCAKSELPARPGAANADSPSSSAEADSSDATASDVAVASVRSLHEGQPVTDDEAIVVARAIEKAVLDRDESAFLAQFDWDSFERLIGDGIPGDSRAGKGIRNAVLVAHTGRQAGNPLAARIVQEVSGGGSYRPVRIRDDKGQKSILFRLVAANGGLNYHEVLLARRAGLVRPVDIYVYILGERLTESIQRMLLAQLPPTTRFGFQGKAKISLADIQSCVQMLEANNNGDPQRAIEIFQSLPEDVRRVKAIMIVRAMAAQKVDEATYTEALDEFQAAHPKEPSLNLLLIDRHLLRGDFDAAHEAISLLNEAVENDPYLQLVHANAFCMEGKFDLARDMTQGFLQREPQSVEAHWSLISISLKQRDFPEVARLLTKVRDELGVQLGDLKDVPDYAEFVTSPEYARWLSAAPPAAPLP